MQHHALSLKSEAVLGHWGVRQLSTTPPFWTNLITGVVIRQIQGVREPGARWNLLTFLTNTQRTGCSKCPELKESQWSILMRTGAFLMYTDSRWVYKVLLGIATESWEQRNARCWCWKLLFSLPSLCHRQAQRLSSHSVKLEVIISIVLPQAHGFLDQARVSLRRRCYVGTAAHTPS